MMIVIVSVQSCPCSAFHALHYVIPLLEYTLHVCLVLVYCQIVDLHVVEKGIKAEDDMTI